MRMLLRMLMHYGVAGSRLLLLLITFTGTAQSPEGLVPLEGHRIMVYYSGGAKEQAMEMAERCDRVLNFYKPLLDFVPDVTLLVLAPADWGIHTSFPVYGMPHFDDVNRLIVASEDNDFWKSFIPPVDSLPGELAHQISATYVDKNGELSMRGFFDLLAIHELGHAFHMQGGLTMQRRWMGELFSNIFLHSYIAEKEPELLPALTVFPRMVVESTDKKGLPYSTLQQLEVNYDLIGQQFPNNYGWYQCRWHMAAGAIYDAEKIDAMQKLWHVLWTQKEVLDDRTFAELLAERVGQSVADVPMKWDE